MQVFQYLVRLMAQVVVEIDMSCQFGVEWL